jgi:hypothetical protein
MKINEHDRYVHGLINLYEEEIQRINRQKKMIY